MVAPTMIKVHMEVLGADGVHVGTVDQLEGRDQVKLTKDDPDSLVHGFNRTIDWRVVRRLAAILTDMFGGTPSNLAISCGPEWQQASTATHDLRRCVALRFPFLWIVEGHFCKVGLADL